MGKAIFGGIIGGVIAFVWSFVSWMVLPWHDSAIQEFRNQEFVSWVLKENTKKDGVYVAPHMKSQDEFAFKEMAQTQAGENQPFVYVQIKRRGIDFTSAKHYIIAFLTQFIGATLISALLLQAKELRYGGRLLFVTLIGLLIGILSQVPNWNWMGGGTVFSLVMIADYVVTWFLAGLLLAAVIKPKRELLI